MLARFTVPDEAPWPEELWGYRLGVRVGNLRTTGRFLTGVDDETREERIALLDRLGFEWKPRLPKKELVRACVRACVCGFFVWCVLGWGMGWDG